MSKRKYPGSYWRLHFIGGPLNGQTKAYPYLPTDKFGHVCKKTRNQFFYRVASSDADRREAMLFVIKENESDPTD